METVILCNDLQALHIAFWNRQKEIQQLLIDAGGLLQVCIVLNVQLVSKCNRSCKIVQLAHNSCLD